MASTAGTRTLQKVILPLAYHDQPDKAVDTSLQVWLSLSGADQPIDPSAYIQKAWDCIVTCKVATELLVRTTMQMDKAHLLAASAAHAGD